MDVVACRMLPPHLCADDDNDDDDGRQEDRLRGEKVVLVFKRLFVKKVLKTSTFKKSFFSVYSFESILFRLFSF